MGFFFFYGGVNNMTRNSKSSRNSFLVQGVPKYSRAAMHSKRGRYLKKDWKPVEKKDESTPPTVKDFCGGKRTIVSKAPKWYPAEDLPSRRAVKKAAKKPTKLRSSITPGTILILLAGKFAGKRVVFLKQLESGLLLVSGPYKLNGVPLRRVNQAYFKKPAQAKKAGKFFADDKKEKNTVSDSRKADQATVDSSLVPAVKNVAGLENYLRARFSLTKGQFPHAMKF